MTGATQIDWKKGKAIKLFGFFVFEILQENVNV
jgi:hypothetical protein